MIDKLIALGLVKARLNRLQADTSLDNYLNARIDSVISELQHTIGIHLSDSDSDIMLVVDMTVWQYQNRDKPGSMPEWLRLQLRQRWLKEGAK